MRYLSYPSLAAVGLCVAFSANAQDARDPIDEALAVDEQESGVLAPRDAAAAAQIEPRSGEDQGFGSSVYTVGPISLEGLRELSVADFVDIVERYAARDLDGEQLNALASDVASRAQTMGYVFATAMIEPQSLRAGVLRVRVDEGRIDRIRIDGDDDAAIRNQLNPLLGGRPVTKGTLARPHKRKARATPACSSFPQLGCTGQAPSAGCGGPCRRSSTGDICATPTA